MAAPLTPAPAAPDTTTVWWRVEVLDWDMSGTPTVVAAPLRQSFSKPGSDLGGAALTLRSSETAAAQLRTEHSVVRFSILDVAATIEAEAPVWRWVAAGICDRPTEQVIASGEEASETIAATLRGPLAMLAYSTIDPAAGAGSTPSPKYRVWNFSHHSIDPHSGSWTDATYRGLQGNPAAVAPNGRGGQPQQFANPLAYWLAPRAAVAGSDPEGEFLLAFDYTHAGGRIIFEGTADDAMVVMMNEMEVGRVWDFPTGDAAEAPYRGFGDFPAGTVRVRVAVSNFPKPGNPKNCGLFVMAASTPTWTTDGYDETWLFTTSDGYALSPGTAGRWRALDYAHCSPIPGPEVGWALVDCWTDARARGELAGLELGFTATHDSDGNPWATFTGVDGFRIEIGKTMWDLVEALRDAGWIDFDYSFTEDGKIKLLAWNQGAHGSLKSDVFVVGNPAKTGNVTGLEHGIDHAGEYDSALVMWPGGTTQIGSGRKRTTIAVDATTEAEAVAKASVILGKAVTVDSWTVDATWLDQPTGPIWGWDNFDEVPLPTTAAPDGPTEPFKVVAIAAEADQATGRPVYKVQLNARAVEQERRVARLAMRDEAMGGRNVATLPTAPNQRAMTKVDLISYRWNLPGAAKQATSGLDPVDKLMRLTRFGATATGGAGFTTCLVKSGTALAANVDLSGAGPLEAWQNVVASVLRPEKKLQAQIGYSILGATALGTHTDIVLVGYGAAMGVQPQQEGYL